MSLLFANKKRNKNQPFVRDYMVKNHSTRFERAFGQRRAKSMMEATAGSIIGVGEVCRCVGVATEAAARVNGASSSNRCCDG